MLLRAEFNNNNDTFTFLYVTTNIRISSDSLLGFKSKWYSDIKLEDKYFRVLELPLPLLEYINLSEEEYFQQSLITAHLDDVIKAAKFVDMMIKEHIYV